MYMNFICIYVTWKIFLYLYAFYSLLKVTFGSDFCLPFGYVAVLDKDAAYIKLVITNFLYFVVFPTKSFSSLRYLFCTLIWILFLQIIHRCSKSIISTILLIGPCTQWCQTLCNPVAVACQALLSMGIFRQKYWNGLPFPTAGKLPDSGTEAGSLVSPELAGRFFTTSTTLMSLHLDVQSDQQRYSHRSLTRCFKSPCSLRTFVMVVIPMPPLYFSFRLPLPPVINRVFIAPGAFLVAQLIKNSLKCRIPWFNSWVGMFPWRRDMLSTRVFLGFPGDLDGKEFACSARDLGSSLVGKIPWSRVCNPLQYSCLENPPEQRSLAGYSPWGHKESDTTEQLSIAQHITITLSKLF